MNATVNMTIRIDKTLKQDVDKLFKDLGINTSSAIMMFLKQCDRMQGLPFTPNMITKEPGPMLQEALKEADEISKDKNRKGYNNIDDVIKALND